MTRKSRAKSSSLFLLELILAILIFSIASAVCVQFFVKSHLMSRDSRILSLSVNEVSGVAELIGAADSLEDAADSILALNPDTVSWNAGGSSEQVDLILYYNDNFLMCQEPDATYQMDISLTEKDWLLSASLNVTSLQKPPPIYSLDITHHLQRRVINE